MLPKSYWQDMTTVDFNDPKVHQWIAVLPVAAIEQHGPHLPVSTDTCIAEGYIDEVIRKLPKDLPVTVLPIQSIGQSTEHVNFAGTLTKSWRTTIESWLEICTSVHRTGVRKLVLVSSHGGNNPLVNIIIQELREKYQMLAVGTSWARFGQPDGLYSEEERNYGIHGGDIETSIMLHLRPDLVLMEKAENFASNQQQLVKSYEYLRAYGPHQFGWLIQDLNVNGAVGDATLATAEKGKATVSHVTNEFLKLLQDINQFDLNQLQIDRFLADESGK